MRSGETHIWRKGKAFLSTAALVWGVQVALLPAPPAVAISVSPETAGAIATGIFTPVTTTGMESFLPDEPPARTVAGIRTKNRKGIALYHVVSLDPQGWVIVSADDVARPILAYSPTGTAPTEQEPLAFTEWMADREEEIYRAVKGGRQPHPKVAREWRNALTDTRTAAPLAGTVGPLLGTIWGQGGWVTGFLLPWLVSEDYYCPHEINWAGYYNVAPTGCVATAMGQIMRYWNWPDSGTGTHTSDPPYNPTCNNTSPCTDTFGPMTVNFAAEVYDWSIMPDDVWLKISGTETAGDREVAKLLRHIGVATDMNYTPSFDGSSTQMSKASDAFLSYFRYHATAEERAWASVLKRELDAGRPVLVGGKGPAALKGHAFVCDGYDSDLNFHFNWGWDGRGNGYYAWGALTPPGSDYSYGNTMVYEIQPDAPPVAVCRSAALSLDEDGLAVLDPDAIDDGSSDPFGRPVSLEASRTSFDCSDRGVLSVTLGVSNGLYSSTCIAEVTVTDDMPPVARAKNAVAPLDADGLALVTTDMVDDGSSDNCAIAGMNVSPGAFGCSDTGPHDVTLTVVDTDGNTDSAWAVVSVHDSLPPQIFCPKDITVEPEGSQGTAVVFESTASDNCSSPTLSCSHASGTLFAVGTDTAVTCTATDRSGLESTCGFQVKVLSEQEVVEEMLRKVEILMKSGVNRGLCLGLESRLRGILAKYATGGPTAGRCNKIESLLIKVRTAVRHGQLTQRQGSELAESAARLLATGCPPPRRKVY